MDEQLSKLERPREREREIQSKRESKREREKLSRPPGLGSKNCSTAGPRPAPAPLSGTNLHCSSNQTGNPVSKLNVHYTAVKNMRALKIWQKDWAQKSLCESVSSSCCYEREERFCKSLSGASRTQLNPGFIIENATMGFCQLCNSGPVRERFAKKIIMWEK